MIRRRRQYVLLLASLPGPGPLFREQQTPISRYRLDQRLALLEPGDAALLRRIEDVLQWSNLPMTRTDAGQAGRAAALLASLDDEPLAAMVRYRLELRVIVAALRRRAVGGGPFGREFDFVGWMALARRRWDDPDFGLAGLHPWVAEAGRLLAARRSLDLERLLLARAWDQHGAVAQGHPFDFVAVVAYVLRWAMVARWARLNHAGAQARFVGLVQAGLAGYPAFAPGEAGQRPSPP